MRILFSEGSQENQKREGILEILNAGLYYEKL